MNKNRVRLGNSALYKKYRKMGFDVHAKMVELYPLLAPPQQLNLLQTLMKHMEIVPIAPQLKVSRNQEADGTKQLKASVVDNLPIEEVYRLASGQSQQQFLSPMGAEIVEYEVDDEVKPSPAKVRKSRK